MKPPKQPTVCDTCRFHRHTSSFSGMIERCVGHISNDNIEKLVIRTVAMKVLEAKNNWTPVPVSLIRSSNKTCMVYRPTLLRSILDVLGVK
jgi:hypothetical protein